MQSRLSDGFGRVHRDLRISVTDRCNFRCTYCMPENGVDWLDRDQMLTFEEIERIARILVERYGFGSVRLTGGEPTVRANLALLIRKLADLGVDVALTTNGATFAHQARLLAESGLKRVNVSLDSLRAERFAAITRRDEIGSVLAGIDAAIQAGLSPVKINAVVMRGINDDEILDFARFGRERGVVVRFIEFMPLDASGNWSSDQVVTYSEIIERISAVYPIEPIERGSSPAERFRYVDGGGELGVIASVTQSFCASCDRVRLMADGHMRSCLFAHEDTDLRTPIRAGATDDEIAAIIEAMVGSKWAGHNIGTVQFIRPSRTMSQIGG